MQGHFVLEIEAIMTGRCYGVVFEWGLCSPFSPSQAKVSLFSSFFSLLLFSLLPFSTSGVSYVTVSVRDGEKRLL